MTITNTMPLVGQVPAFSLGDRLRKARELRGWDQAELADLLGVHRQTIARAEKGVGTTSKPLLIAWAQTAGVNLTWLLGSEDVVFTVRGTIVDWDEGAEVEPIDLTVRPEGFEPPTFWSVAAGAEPQLRCFACGGPHDLDDCPTLGDLDDLALAA